MEQRIAPRIRCLHWCTGQHLNEALSEMDLTGAQSCAMRYLSRQSQPPLTRDFEKDHQLSHACAAGILSRLEKKEFIEFRTDANDRRCKRIYILPKGEACNQHMREKMDAIEKQMMAGFSPEEQALFLSLVERAIANLNTKPRRCTSKEDRK